MTTLKRLAVSGTALKHKLTYDIFFRSRIKIFACVFIFLLCVLVGILLLLDHQKQFFSQNMPPLSMSAQASDAPTQAAHQIDTITNQTLLVLVFLVMFFGIIVTEIATEPIRQALRMQKRFISGIAHELRTPLSILRMNNEIAHYGLDPTSPTIELLDENIADIDRINEILHNLLLFDRITSTDSLHFEEVDLGAVAKSVAKRLDRLSKRKEITVTVTDSPIPTVLGNKTAIEQVLFNIMKNGIAYTPHGGMVRVECKEYTSTSVTLAIADTGMGIPAHDLVHIFEPYYRSHKTEKVAGTGIGLAIVHEIMKLHHGIISVESVENSGTIFFLTFPRFVTKKVARSQTTSGQQSAFDFNSNT